MAMSINTDQQNLLGCKNVYSQTKYYHTEAMCLCLMFNKAKTLVQ